ncbi:hypothetical protein NO976_04425 (plasmid) [Planktothrix agardhii]|nr:hypothetical protein NO976_04425 [Planktothrix agardhii]
MQKSTFKIATNFIKATRYEPAKPTDFIEVEGLVIGDWGIYVYLTVDPAFYPSHSAN